MSVGVKEASVHRANPSPELRPDEFEWIRRFLHQQSGIALNDSKRALVTGRLEKRLRHHRLGSYGDYFRLLGQPGQQAEAALVVDLLTTNETFFFREPKHFEFLREQLFISHPRNRPLRCWSAASSSGEEAYTLAMLLAEHGPSEWEVIGTDISGRVIEKAQRGLYPLAAADKIPLPLLKKYCLKGHDEYEGLLRIQDTLRARVRFLRANLLQPLPELGLFDVILLRNVMIYFDMPTKQRLLDKLQPLLRPGGYFIISHSETLNGISTALKPVQPSIYRSAGA